MISSLPDDILICGLGAVTPVGRDALSSAAAVRAGLTGFTQHPIMADMEGRPVMVAACPWFADGVAAERRMSDLLLHAVHQAIQPLAASASQDRTPAIGLLVNLPLARPGISDDLSLRIKGEIDRSMRLFDSVVLAQRGHAGALMALKSAAATIVARKNDACVIAGTDSYMDLETLEWLEETDQLHGAGARNNAWGFVPGEGAGAVLLIRRETAERYGVQSVARLAAVSVSKEEHLIRTDSVCLGVGLTAAFRSVIAHLDQGLLISDMYCDMNGDPYRANEYGFAVTRTREHFVSPSEFVAPADCWGDVGAASVPLCLSLSAIASRKAYAKGEAALVWASSDSGERGAALILGG